MQNFNKDKKANFNVIKKQVRPKWGRIIFVMTIITVSVALFGASAGQTLGGTPLANASEVSNAKNENIYKLYVVQPGDTIWSISSKLSKGQDVRRIQHDLVQRYGTNIEPGDSIQIKKLI